MNNALRQIIEQVEQLDPLVQEAVIKEFQRIVQVVANVSPGDVMPWDEQFERFTLRARAVLRLAQDEAQRLKAGHIGTEHLLLGLLREDGGLGAGILTRLGVDLAEERRQTLRAIGKGE
jgi:hypothetical protein